MKKFLRILLYSLGLIILVVVGFVLFLEIRGIPHYSVEKINYPPVEVTPERVAMGEKIAAVQCMFCHHGSDGKLSGRLLYELPPAFGEIHSANITQSKEHGIGNWTDEQIAFLLRTGVKPDGQYLPVYMPKFPHASDEDIKSIIAFLHSSDAVVQPSEIAKMPSSPSLLTKFLCFVQFKKIPYPGHVINMPDSNNLVAYGHYLVTGRYDCYPCHSKDFKTLNMEVPEKSEGFMGGGNTLIASSGKIRLSPNITCDETTGLGTWTYEDFSRAMHQQKNKDGKTLRDPMLPYNSLTDNEVHAIWAYLQTVPKLCNKVERNWQDD